MQRDLKFRAWDRSQKYMAYQGDADLETLSFFMFHFGSDIIMQYTGRDDVNKMPIFEGDFLKCTNPESMFFHVTQDVLSSYFLVLWDKRKNGWNSFPISTLSDEDFNKAIQQFGGSITWPDDNVLNNSWHFEIIGNMYENPEMALWL